MDDSVDGEVWMTVLVVKVCHRYGPDRVLMSSSIKVEVVVSPDVDGFLNLSFCEVLFTGLQYTLCPPIGCCVQCLLHGRLARCWCPLCRQPFGNSLILVLSCLPVAPTYTRSHSHGIEYTHPSSFPAQAGL